MLIVEQLHAVTDLLVQITAKVKLLVCLQFGLILFNTKVAKKQNSWTKAYLELKTYTEISFIYW